MSLSFKPNSSFKKYIYQILIISLFLTVIATVVFIFILKKSQEAGLKPEYIAGEVTVYFKNTISRRDGLDLLNEYGIKSKYAEYDDFTRKYHINFSRNKDTTIKVLNESGLFESIGSFVGDYYDVKEKITVRTTETNNFLKNHPEIDVSESYGITDGVIVPVGQEQKYIKMLRESEYVRDVDQSALPVPM
jgi:hypothetical protein